MVFHPEFRPKKNFILYTFSLFVVANIASSLFGAFPTLSFWGSSMRGDGVIYLVHILLFFLIFASLVQNKKLLDKFLLVSVISSCLVTLSVYLGGAGTGIIKFFLAGGTFGVDSITGTYLLFNLFFAIYLFFQTPSRKRKILLFFIVIFELFSPIFFNFDIWRGVVQFSSLIHHPTIAIGSARGAVASFCIGMILSALLLLSKDSKKIISKSAKILSGFFLFSILLSVTLFFISGNPLNRWFNQETGNFRNIYVQQAVKGFEERPLLGWGYGNFSMVNDKYFNPIIFNDNFLGETNADRVHNIVFDTLTNSGAIGFLFYVSIFIATLILLWKSNISHLIKSLFSVLLLAYVLQNLVFFDTPISYLMFALLLASIVILSNYFDSTQEEEKEAQDAPQGRFSVIFLIFCISMGIFFAQYFSFLPFEKNREDYKFYTFPFEVRGTATYEYDQISPFGIGDNEQYIRTIYFGYLGNMATLKKLKSRDVYVADIDNMVAKTLSADSSSPPMMLEMFWIYKLYSIRYELTGGDSLSLSKMEEYGKKTIELFSNDLRGYIHYAIALSYEKKYKDALDVLEKIYFLYPSSKDLNKDIIVIAKEMNDPKLLKEKTERAERNIPGFIPN